MTARWGDPGTLTRLVRGAASALAVLCSACDDLGLDQDPDARRSLVTPSDVGDLLQQTTWTTLWGFGSPQPGPGGSWLLDGTGTVRTNAFLPGAYPGTYLTDPKEAVVRFEVTERSSELVKLTIQVDVAGRFRAFLEAEAHPHGALRITGSNLEGVPLDYSEAAVDIAINAFGQWKRAGSSLNGLDMAMSTMADAHSSSWGNFGMNDMSSEPRAPINNSLSYAYRGNLEYPWWNLYRALAGVRDGLVAIDAGLEIGDGRADTERYRAFAKLVQGLAHGGLALLYDQAFVVDEKGVDLGQMLPYTAVMNAALRQLDEAIRVAEGNAFTTPPDWVGGTSLTSEELARLAHTIRARLTALNPRSRSERDAVDWSQVLADIDLGVDEGPDTYSSGLGDPLWDAKKWPDGRSTWTRADYRTIGPADQSGGYASWLNTPLAQRDEFPMDVDDHRITDPFDPADSCLNNPSCYFGWGGASPFPPDRGTYHYSLYVHRRHETYGADGQGWLPLITSAEIDMLRAEAMFRTGDVDGALTEINKYRQAAGLPAATAEGAPEIGGRCTPRHDGVACGDLWEALKYEKRMETFTEGIAYYDDRGWGDLVPGTPVHFPVPAGVLERVHQEIYTWGGVGGDGAAPAVTPGDLESALRRLRFTHRMLQEAQPEDRRGMPGGPPTPRRH